MNDLASPKDDPWLQQRLDMVESQIIHRGIKDSRVLDAMTHVPRHLFVPKNLQNQAYDDCPLPIGYSQTISQPYIVALMTELVQPQPLDRALDIGTGCGYQAAVLSRLVQEVYSIEIVEALANQARSRLENQRLSNVLVQTGDGYLGWEEYAPFQIILVAAAPDHVPQPLLDQLASGGRMVIPVGRYSQELLLIEKLPDGSLKRTAIAPVMFVPMTGTAEKK
jgi:protein-L-isoaspartate(D-aspartate) O-methyltransferase